MMTEVKRAFGPFTEGFPISAFLEQPTIETLARIIEGNIGQKASSLAVCLQPRGTKNPLFLIHAGGGYVFFYRALALHLGLDRPVYGVRAKTDSIGQGRPFSQSRNFEEIAAAYIAEIKSVQPKGPYSLGGGCAGGVIAFEMAQQLRSQGEEIAGPVFLFDAYIMNNPYLSEEDIYVLQNAGHLPVTGFTRLRWRISRQLRQLAQLSTWNALCHIGSKIMSNTRSELTVAFGGATRRLGKFFARVAALPKSKAPHVQETSETPEQMQKRFMKDFLEVSIRLISKYVPIRYAGSIAVFTGNEGSAESARLWSGLAKGGIIVHKMPGDHLDMMEEPTVARTAALVRKCLLPDGVQSGASTRNEQALREFVAETDEVQFVQSSERRFYEN